MFSLSEKDIARFWRQVNVGEPDQCWEWTSKSKHWRGYGLFAIANGKSGGLKIVASRVSCFIAYGPPPEGLPNALHSCDNPPCCNPHHLRWGTAKHNSEDAVKRGRASPPPVNYPGRHTGKMPKGEALYNNTLTEAIAREIMRLHMIHWNVSQIAAEVGKPKHVIADVCRGRSWRHLEGIPSIEELKTGGVRRGFNQFS